MGFWSESKAEIPATTTLPALILLILNIFAPPIGTLIMSFMGGFKVKTLLVFFLQILLFPILIGYIWSIYWGIIVLQKSK